MKKITLLLIGLCLLCSCNRNKNKDYSINYNGSKDIEIVLREKLKIEATSEDPIQYYSENELVAKVTSDGIIEGINIGETDIKLSNTKEELTIHVDVNLFEEPTLEFGESQDYIKKIYGEPTYAFGDSVYRYGGGEVHPDDWFSFTVWQTDFFFKDNQYIESDVYLSKEWEPRLNEYLEKFSYQGVISDTVGEQITEYHVYLNDENPEDATVLMGKIYNVGLYKDICLFYIPYKNESRSHQIVIPRRIRKN